MPEKTSAPISLKPVATLTDGWGTFIAFATADGSIWASGREDGVITLWRDTELVKTIEVERCGQLRFTADGRWLLASPAIIDVAAQSALPLPRALEPSRYRMHGFVLLTSAFVDDGDRLAVAVKYQPHSGGGPPPRPTGDTAQVILLDGHSRVLKQVLEPGEIGAFVSGAELFVAANLSIEVWRAKDLSHVASMPRGGAVSLRFSADGGQLAAAITTGDIRIWETHGFSEIAHWHAHEGWANAVAFLPDRPIMFTGGDDNQLKVWRIAGDKAELLLSLPQSGMVKGVELSPDGRRLVIAVSSMPHPQLMLFDVAAP